MSLWWRQYCYFFIAPVFVQCSSSDIKTLGIWSHDCSGGLACYCLVWHMIPCLFLLQIPLAYLTSFPFMRGQLGNVIVWASIVLGQPLAILMYMVEYYRYINWTVLATPQLSSFHSMQYYYNSVGYCCRPVWCFTSARIFSTVMQSLYMYSVLHDIHVNNYQLFWNDYIKKNHTNRFY